MHPSPSNTKDTEQVFAKTQAKAESKDPELDLITEEMSDNRVHLPPPRIAARFYRPSINRRKSSAASSRRNSVSSVHSYQSITRHGETQSSFFAQHQRRNTIIEVRRARLADRAAHVEKVRLRAAFFKSAPRSATNSEERAIAAQQAREKNLADIAAACAEEVKRAKGIAESMKEKREADGKKHRKEIDERLAEAEKRREENLRKCSSFKRARSVSHSHKNHSLSSEISKTISVDIAASRIQRKWRIYQRKKIVEGFIRIGLNIKKVRQESFDYVARLLEQEGVLVLAAGLLRICGIRGTECQSISDMVNVRSFLSAYLILGHPKQTLSAKFSDEEHQSREALPIKKDDLTHAQVQDLMAKAQKLIISFEDILLKLNSKKDYIPSLVQQTKLSENYSQFFNAFIAWKARDSEALIEMLILQFIELESIWISVKNSTEESVTDSYRDGIRENQIMLMTRIRRLAGEKRYKEEISRAFRKAHISQKSKQSSKYKKVLELDSAKFKSNSTSNSLEITGKSMAAALHALSPPTQSSDAPESKVDVIRFAQPKMQENRVIIHEIAIDREYRIHERFLEEKNTIMQSALQAMRNDIKAGNSDKWVLAMAENVRTKLQRLLIEGKPMHTSIGDWLDHNLIASQLKHQSFSYDRFFDEMGRLLSKLCAPFRDEQFKVITQERFRENDVVLRLEALLHALDILQLDYANFLLQQQIPFLLANAAKYETYQFMQELAASSGSLQRTENAWKLARNRVLSEASKRDPENNKLHHNKKSVEKIYVQMLVDVFTIPSVEAQIPETLGLDLQRVVRIRKEIHRIVTCGAILLQCKNILKRDVRSLWKVEGTRIYMVLEDSKSPQQAILGIQAALESSRCMPSATKDYIHNFVVSRTIVASDSKLREFEDPVLRLLMNRLRGYITSRLSNRTEKDKNKAVNTTSESLVSLGLPEFAQKVSEIIHMISRVAEVDREAHGRWYEQIIEKLNIENSEKSEKMDID